MRRQQAALPPMHDVVVGSGRRPIAFVPYVAEDVRHSPLNHADVDDELLSPAGVDGGALVDEQRPVAFLDARQMGLPVGVETYLRSTMQLTHLTPIQAKLLKHMYALQDVAVSSPTGSGKTLGLAAGLMAKLERLGPPKVMSTVFLVPHASLAYQVERWLRHMWCFQDDSNLVQVVTDDMAARHVRRVLMGPTTNGTDRRPYVIVGTPAAMWEYYADKHERMLTQGYRGRTKNQKRMSCKPVLHAVDTVLIDEADAVLPPRNADAPGNRLVARLTAQVKFQAPVHVVATSATLSPSVLNHVRKFLRRPLFHFSQGTNVISPQSCSQDNGHDVASGVASLNGVTSTGADARRSGGRSSRGDSTSSSFHLPQHVERLFYIADTPEEQIEAVGDIFTRWHEAVHLLGEGNTKGEPLRALFVIPNPEISATLYRNTVIPGALQRVALATRDSATESNGRLTCSVRMLRSCLADGRAVGRGPRNACRHDEDVDATLVVVSPGDASRRTEGGPVPAASLPTSCCWEVLCCGAADVRGLDLPRLTHVVIFVRPSSPADYVHWAGRVGRMGQPGTAVVVMPRHVARVVSSFCETLGIEFRVERRRFQDIDV